MGSPSTDGKGGWKPPSVEHLRELLPSYEIVRLIGRGGMGAVYEGIQTNLDRRVAIKILPESLGEMAGEMNFVERFKLEAKSMAKLDHPGIISVYDFGTTEDDQLYFVMEYIDGMDIHRYLQHHGGTLPPEHAVAIVAHVLDALGYAHDQGIIHRDIKPPNVMIKSDGRVKLADFGLVKKLSENGEANTDSVALTLSNVALGTPDYVAPEALQAGALVDHRADLYAVGVMFYQLLTGTVPRGNFRPPSGKIEGLDPRIDKIVSHAMEADPEDRYQSATEFRAGIDEILKSPVPAASADPAPGGIPGGNQIALATAPNKLRTLSPSNNRPAVVPGSSPAAANVGTPTPVGQGAPISSAVSGRSNTGLIVGAITTSVVALAIVLVVLLGGDENPDTKPDDSDPGDSDPIEVVDPEDPDGPDVGPGRPDGRPPLGGPGRPRPGPGGGPGHHAHEPEDLMPFFDLELSPAHRRLENGVHCKPPSPLVVDYDMGDRNGFILDAIISTKQANGFEFSLPVADRRLEVAVDVAGRLEDPDSTRRVSGISSAPLGSNHLRQVDYPDSQLIATPGKPHRIVIKVNRSEVSLEVDGSYVVGLDGPLENLQFDWAPIVNERECRGKIVFHPYGPYVIHRMQLLPPGARIRPVDMSVFNLPGSPNPPGPDPGLPPTDPPAPTPAIPRPDPVIPSPPVPQDLVASRLAELEKEFHERFEAPHRDSLATLASQFEAALKREEDNATADGNLDTILIFEKEIKRIAEGRGAGAPDEPDIPKSLSDLRTTWHEEIAKLEQKRSQGRLDSLELLNASLDGYEQELVKQKDIEGAKRVRELKDTLNKEPVPGGVVVTPPVSPGGPSTPGKTPAPEAPLDDTGRVKVWGLIGGQPADGRSTFGPALAGENFQSVAVGGRDHVAVLAIREDGSGIRAIHNGASVAKKEFEKIVAFNRNGCLFAADGAVFQRDIPNSAAKIDLPAGSQLAGGVDSLFVALKPDGLSWGGRLEADYPKLFKDKLDQVTEDKPSLIASLEGSLVWVAADGMLKAHGFDELDELFHSEPDQKPNNKIVQLLPADGDLGLWVALDSKGNVYAEGVEGLEEPVEEWSPATQVRVSNDTIAVRRPGGAWEAFGPDEELNRFISGLTAIDLDFLSTLEFGEVSHRIVAWVEPVGIDPQFPPPAEGPSETGPPAGPVPAPPSIPTPIPNPPAPPLPEPPVE